jgi:hypothetical protein
MKIDPIRERIVETDHIATAFNRQRLGGSMSRRIVVLACGHRAITRNAKDMACQRCTEMLRRSVETGEEDYESFRHRGHQDTMTWVNDPCRCFNEPTDLAGNFTRDPGQHARPEGK